MLEAVRLAKNVDKPVQQALAEAIDAFKHAKVAREELHESRNSWLTKVDDERRRTVARETSTNVGDSDSPSVDNLTAEFSSLRSEVGELSKAVVKKSARKKNSQTQGVQVNGAKQCENTVKANPRGRARPQAIIVDVNAVDFPALATKIRGGVDRRVIGDSITGMRQAKSGGLLIEVRGDQVQFEAVRAEISRSAGSEVEVRALQQRVMVEVRDLDQWSTVTEVAEATASATGTPTEQLRVFSLRKRYGGSQSVLSSLLIKNLDVSAASVPATQRRSALARTERNAADAAASQAIR
ncbi:hypothetical protein QTP88_029712 [Uroleucon formosanum]